MVPIRQNAYRFLNSGWMCSRSEMRIMENCDGAAEDRPTWSCWIVAVDKIVTWRGCARGIISIVHRPDHFPIGWIAVDMDGACASQQIPLVSRHGTSQGIDGRNFIGGS